MTLADNKGREFIPKPWNETKIDQQKIIFPYTIPRLNDQVIRSRQDQLETSTQNVSESYPDSEDNSRQEYFRR